MTSHSRYPKYGHLHQWSDAHGQIDVIHGKFKEEASDKDAKRSVECQVLPSGYVKIAIGNGNL